MAVQSSSKIRTPLFGEALRFHRKNKKMTQVEVAEKSGIETSEISRLEKGLGNPTLIQIKRLAYGLGVTPSKILVIEETYAERKD
ncbi:MAG TPA: helix-turn-helix transcriptional regulator [Solirubrobacterales bacterium]|nr:helix-turn-helix transcriptional regulator [Solirubrobacterales bacterium]